MTRSLPHRTKGERLVHLYNQVYETMALFDKRRDPSKWGRLYTVAQKLYVVAVDTYTKEQPNHKPRGET